MIEKYIVKTKARKSIEHTAKHSITRVTEISPKIIERTQRSQPQLQNEKRCHKIGDSPRRKKQGEQKKRTADKIKAVAADQICTEVCFVAPHGFAV